MGSIVLTIPWNEYLAELPPEEAEATVRNISFVGKIEDQTGIDLMFSGDKVNLNPSYEQVKKFKREVVRAVLLNPMHFLECLITANFKLLHGDKYIWDRGFLPLNYSSRYGKDSYLNSDYFLIKKYPGYEIGSYLRDFYVYFLSLNDISYFATICFSYFPQILLLSFSALYYRKYRGVQMYSLLMLLLYAGVFLMPASMEFRYGFHFAPACLILPLLIGLEKAVSDRRVSKATRA